MKILVTGKTGMLGHKVLEVLSKEFDDVSGISRADFDMLEGSEAFFSKLNEIKPDYIVNCLGVIKPLCKDPPTVIYLNSLFPHLLAKHLNAAGGKLIHVSTDCVFDGKKGDYSVNDPYTANDLYGMSKALGEVRDARNLTIRTSIIGRETGGNKKSLVEWFLQQKECNGFTNHIWNGVTTRQVGITVAEIIRKQPSLCGLHQLAASKPVNKYELLCLLREHYKLSTTIHPVEANERVDRSMIPTIVSPPIEKMIAEM